MKMAQRKLVIGNWKMNGSREHVHSFMTQIRSNLRLDVDVVVCVPFPYLFVSEHQLSGGQVALGAQDVSPHLDGAHTGEVSSRMLKELGCQYVLVGHSERRSDHGENDALVLAKVRAALGASLIPVVCVGESLAERKSGMTNEVVLSQVRSVIRSLSPAERRRCVIAYEPIWAIGTGLSATPEQAQKVHECIRRELKSIDDGLAAETCLLYGGSVKPESAAALFAQKDIDGGLIGGASLSLREFSHIVKIAERYAPCENDFFEEGL